MMKRRRHHDLALEFYAAIVGRKDLPHGGMVMSIQSDVVPWVTANKLIKTYANRGDPAFRQHQQEVDGIRRRLNSGACCMTLPQNRRYRIVAEPGGTWRMLPFAKAAEDEWHSYAIDRSKYLIRKTHNLQRDLEIAVLPDDETVPIEIRKWFAEAAFQVKLLNGNIVHFASQLAMCIAQLPPSAAR